MKTYEIFVPGDPVAQPRPRAVSMGGKARMYNPKTAKAWKQKIGLAVLAELAGVPMFEGALVVDCVFYMARPKSHFGTGRNAEKLKSSAPKHCTKKPDLDNLVKAVFDSLTDHKVWKDDSYVTGSYVGKRWADDFDAGVSITILDLEG